MRVAILDDIHQAWEGTEGVRRLRERAEVLVFTGPFGDPAALRGFDTVIANRERTRFTRRLLEQLSDVRVIVQTGNHASHIDFAAAHDCGILVARASAGYSIGAAELTFGLAMAVMRQIPASDAALRRGRGRRRRRRCCTARPWGSWASAESAGMSRGSERRSGCGSRAGVVR